MPDVLVTCIAPYSSHTPKRNLCSVKIRQQRRSDGRAPDSVCFRLFQPKQHAAAVQLVFVWQQNHLISCRVLSSCWFRAALVLLSDIFRLLGCSLRVCCVKFAVILRVKQTYTPVHANKEDSRIIELVLRKFFFRFFRFSQKARGCNR